MAKRKKLTLIGDIDTRVRRAEKRQQDHEEHDSTRFANISETLALQPTREDLEKIVAMIPSKEDVKTLKELMIDDHGNLKIATKEDIQGMLSFYNVIHTTAKAISTGSGWWYRTVVIILATAAFFALVTGSLKGLVAWTVNSVLHP